MKTEELLKKIADNIANWNEITFKEAHEKNLNLINQFKSEACKAQRENCSNIFYENKALPYNMKMAVLNAVEPE